MILAKLLPLPEFTSFKFSNYRFWWISSGAVMLNMFTTQMAMSWWVLNRTDSPEWVGVTIFSFGLPALLFTIPAGALADKVDKRKLLMAAQFGALTLSLTFALLRFGAQLIFVPGEGLELPDHIKQRIESVYDAPIEKVKPIDLDLGALFRDGVPPSGETADIDAVYMTPSRPHQLAIYQDEFPTNLPNSKDSVDLYFTRYQKERDSGTPRKLYPKVSRQVLRRKGLSKAMIMHPLPRIDEISIELDQDPRSRYFEQARNGVPVRMALLALLLNKKPWSSLDIVKQKSCTSESLVSQVDGVSCSNLNCVSQTEPQNCDGEIVVYKDPSTWFLCKYCEREIHVAAYGYKGKKVYHKIKELKLQSHEQLGRIRFYFDESEAKKNGLIKSQRNYGGVSQIDKVGT